MADVALRTIKLAFKGAVGPRKIWIMELVSFGGGAGRPDGRTSCRNDPKSPALSLRFFHISIQLSELNGAQKAQSSLVICSLCLLIYSKSNHSNHSRLAWPGLSFDLRSLARSFKFNSELCGDKIIQESDF